MRGRDLPNLLVLATAWGGFFLFIRLTVPEFGTFLLIFLRMGLATLCLLPLVILRRQVSQLIKHGPALFFAGLFNAALPCTLFAMAPTTWAQASWPWPMPSRSPRAASFAGSG